MQNKLLYWGALILNINFLVVNIFQNHATSWISVAFVLNLVLLIAIGISSIFQKRALYSLIVKDKGSWAGKISVKGYLKEMQSFVQQVQVMLNNITIIGQAGFADSIGSINDTSIRTPLLSANSKIVELRKKEAENIWIARGVAAISELKQKDNSIRDYTFQIISTIVKYLNAQQGCFFLEIENGEDPYFELSASYAYEKSAPIGKRVNHGEGSVGQVFYGKEIIYLTDVPKDYLKITSGLGEAVPRCVCIIPLLTDGKIYGVMEIASLHELGAAEMEYLKKIAENVGYALSSIEYVTRTELLLEETQKMAEELKSQETELRQNMTELAVTQEQMKRKKIEMDSLLSSLSVIELDLDGKITYVNEIFTGTTGYALVDIAGKHYNYLTQNEDPAQFEIMWNSILTGRVFSGEFKLLNSEQREIWTAGNFTPILNEDNRPYKVIVISVFTTRDKEKLLELQELVSAFKACFAVAEINQDLSFKSANDLFLLQVGIKRLELKKMSPKGVFQEESYNILEKYLQTIDEGPNNTTLDIVHKDGAINSFNSTLFKLNIGSQRKKGLVILKNSI
ncbi:MAG: GAF domain-containing protein [Chryseolinea sp.]